MTFMIPILALITQLSHAGIDNKFCPTKEMKSPQVSKTLNRLVYFILTRMTKKRLRLQLIQSIKDPSAFGSGEVISM